MNKKRNGEHNLLAPIPWKILEKALNRLHFIEDGKRGKVRRFVSKKTGKDMRFEKFAKVPHFRILTELEHGGISTEDYYRQLKEVLDSFC